MSRPPRETPLERLVQELAVALFGRPARELTRRQWAHLREWRCDHPDWRPGDPVT